MDIPLIHPQYCVIHITDTQLTTTPAQIEAYWKTLGWQRPGYHVVCAHDGLVTRLQNNKFISNGVRPYQKYSNRNCFNLAFIGGRVGRKLLQDTRTEAQKAAMGEVIKWYMNQYPDLMFVGHNQINRKHCPSFDTPAWLAEVGVPAPRIVQSDPFNTLKFIRTGKW